MVWLIIGNPLGFSQSDDSLIGDAVSYDRSTHVDAGTLGPNPGLTPAGGLHYLGPLGAGKTHLARAIVQAASGTPDLAVPSPSYTLVNVYPGPPEIWHADLYRLTEVSELAELGIEEALDTAIVLVEWPERWPDPPARRLAISLAFDADDRRTVDVRAIGAGWEALLRALCA